MWDWSKLSTRNYDETFPINFLTSVTFEVRFDPLLAIQQKVPTFQEKIRGKYPGLGKGVSFSIGLPFQESPESIQWEFSTKDKTSHIRLSMDRLIFVTKEYKNYSEFRENYTFAFNEFTKTTKLQNFNRLGLRYINEIPLPHENNVIEYILKRFNPIISRSRIEEDAPITFQTEYRVRHDEGLVTLRNNLSFEDGIPKYIIDIDGYSVEVMTSNQIETISEKLHNLIVTEFHKNITDKFLESLRGE
ncbi:MAG: TIGR04255 family protein [Candidatus Lokiarchaeota archaeon]|nr:TIGR04255 family protein [Candidatus Lokiarchaeota archaeon]